MKKTKAKSKSLQTYNIHGSDTSQAWEFSHHLVPPITASTTFRLQSLKRGAAGFQHFANPQTLDKALQNNEPIWIYDRLEEPSSKMLEEHLEKMENRETAVSLSSGRGGISV